MKISQFLVIAKKLPYFNVNIFFTTQEMNEWIVSFQHRLKNCPFPSNPKNLRTSFMHTSWWPKLFQLQCLHCMQPFLRWYATVQCGILLGLWCSFIKVYMKFRFVDMMAIKAKLTLNLKNCFWRSQKKIYTFNWKNSAMWLKINDWKTDS